MSDVRLRIVAITLAWVIIAPLGGPVVPLVYTRVARSLGSTASTSRSQSPGSSASWALPRSDTSDIGPTDGSTIDELSSISTTCSTRRSWSRWSSTFASCSTFSTKQIRASECSST